MTDQCPMNLQEFGRSSWSLLHTYAAYYPQEPTQQNKQQMTGFLQGFKNLLPCKYCKGHFKKDYERDPPNVDNHIQLNLWACRQHNYVNKMLGKGQFICEYKKLMERWKTGCSNEQL